MKFYLALALTAACLAGCGDAAGTAGSADGTVGELMHPAHPAVVALYETQPDSQTADTLTEEAVVEESPERDNPVPPAKLAEIEEALAKEMETLNRLIKTDGENPNLYSRRGSAHFFLGALEKAADDFDREVELEPGRMRSHWRRGIALYYAGRYQESAEQFAKYHEQDTHADRENGIWHFLASAAESNVEKARGTMLVYTKEDSRPVMQHVYEMYQGKATSDEVLEAIESAGLNADEKEQRLFFAHAYIGWLAAVEKDLERGRHHLFQAVANAWGQNAGGGPGYMWHTARVHYDVLAERAEKQDVQE